MRMFQVVTLCIGVSLAGLAACSEKASPQLASDDAARVLINRNWIDVWPTNKTDRLHVYRFVPGMGGGVYQDRTVFKGTFELFRFEVEGGERIVFDLPETHQRVTSLFTIETVAGPKPFDLKLTLATDPRGPQVYYGIRAENDPDGHALEQKLAAQRE
jgi:hypothetical protein